MNAPPALTTGDLSTVRELKTIVQEVNPLTILA
jgi:hypothetical protein